MASFATGWIALTLQNSWAIGNSNTPEYRVDGQGVVWLRGAVINGASGTVACTLPAGARPGATMQFATGGTSGTTVCNVEVDTNGQVTIYSANTAFCYLTGAQFLAEN